MAGLRDISSNYAALLAKRSGNPAQYFATEVGRGMPLETALAAAQDLQRADQLMALQNAPASTSVVDDLIAGLQAKTAQLESVRQQNVAPQYLAQAQPQLQQLPENSGIAPLTPPTMKMAGGGIVAFDEGGHVPGYAGPDGSVVQSDNSPSAIDYGVAVATFGPTIVKGLIATGKAAVRGGQLLLSKGVDLAGLARTGAKALPGANVLLSAAETPFTVGETPTEQYAKRFDMEPGGEGLGGLSKDIGIRSLGAMSDFGNILGMGLPQKWYRDLQPPAAQTQAALPKGEFYGDPNEVRASIAKIPDAKERANALAALTSQLQQGPLPPMPGPSTGPLPAGTPDPAGLTEWLAKQKAAQEAPAAAQPTGLDALAQQLPAAPDYSRAQAQLDAFKTQDSESPERKFYLSLLGSAMEHLGDPARAQGSPLSQAVQALGRTGGAALKSYAEQKAQSDDRQRKLFALQLELDKAKSTGDLARANMLREQLATEYTIKHGNRQLDIAEKNADTNKAYRDALINRALAQEGKMTSGQVNAIKAGLAEVNQDILNAGKDEAKLTPLIAKRNLYLRRLDQGIRGGVMEDTSGAKRVALSDPSYQLDNES